MFTTRPEILGTFGVVTSTHWLATASGMAMLEKGGNAFDACAAAALVLQVVEPHLVGPAGDMPAVFYSAETKKVEVLCAQGSAPQAATIATYKALGLDMIPGDVHAQHFGSPARRRQGRRSIATAEIQDLLSAGDADPGDQLVTTFPHALRDAGEVALFPKRLIRIHESLPRRNGHPHMLLK